MSVTRPVVLLYGDVNLNIMDGSAIWLASMAEVLVGAGADVHVLLKSQVRDPRIVDGLTALDGVSVLAPLGVTAPDAPVGSEESYPQRKAAQVLAHHARELGADVVLCRGLAVCAYLSSNPAVAARLWAYVTDVPRGRLGASSPAMARLQEVATASRVLVAQTEDARTYLESVCPAAAGKTVVLGPMVPDALFVGPVPATPLHPGDELRMVYSGKLARAWNTLEMAGLPERLLARGVPSRLTMIGDKVQDDPKDVGWSGRMRDVMAEERPQVDWLGGVPREEATAEVRRHHVGLGWRDESLDDSLELSTKLLEYAACGVAPVVNRTAAHEELLGAAYPLLVDRGAEVADVLAAAAGTPGLVAAAAATARAAVHEHSFARSAQRLAVHLDRQVVRRTGARRAPRHRVLVAGHDFKFAADVVGALLAEPDRYEVRVDRWSSLHVNDEARSQELVGWADTIFCEWAGPNSVWYSRNKRARQKLYVRLHGFEVRGPWIPDLVQGAVDAMVFVSDFYRDTVVEQLGWQSLPTLVVPNSVDCTDLLRPKVPGSRFHLGLLGIVPVNKRPDRALDLLAMLLEHDDRFVLHVRGRAPWDYPWEWNKPSQRDAYEAVVDQVASAGLTHHVALEHFSPGVAGWQQKLGFILSPSSRETFHVAPLEGMAAGTVPVFWRREGVVDIFGDRFVVDDLAGARDLVLGCMADDAYDEASRAARAAVARYDILHVRRRWSELFGTGDQVP